MTPASWFHRGTPCDPDILERRPPALHTRLAHAFVRDQSEGLMLAAKVRMIAIAPVVLWLLNNQMAGAGAYWWQVAMGAVFLPTSVLHYYAARARTAYGAVYALFALDVALMGFLFVYPNPFVAEPVPPATLLAATPFFWFFFVIVHASFSSNWRLVVWTGGAIMLTRVAQVAWVATRPGATTDGDYAVWTTEGWLAALSDRNFVSIFNSFGDLAGIASFTFASAFLVWRSHRTLERQVLAERARAQIARYVPSSVVDDIMAQGGRFMAPRGADVGILFVDVVGFTRMAERFTPDQSIGFLRDLHGRLAEAVFAHNGAIDKFLGDGLMATFGATSSDGSERRAAEALAAGIDMVAAVRAWNAERAARGEAAIGIGIGIDYGPAVLGDIGDVRRLEFTVVGDTVNVAARVEELTRGSGDALLATERAVAAARLAAEGAAVAGRFEPAGIHTIRGRRGQMALYRLTGEAGAIGAAT